MLTHTDARPEVLTAVKIPMLYRKRRRVNSEVGVNVSEEHTTLIFRDWVEGVPTNKKADDGVLHQP
jgi:hypothetical protein